MSSLVFRKESLIPCTPEELFRWHEHPDAFRKLMPPGEPVQIIHHDGAIRDGSRAVLRVGFWPLAFIWELEHRDYIFGQQFCDVQVHGPFKQYRHNHLITAAPDGAVLIDEIRFEMPLGFFGQWLGRLIMMPKFKRLFEYRHRVTREAFA